MKKTRPFILQFAIWMGIWAVFAFTGNESEKLSFYYLVLAVRMLSHALFFNLMYYGLLPLYFSGKARTFYLLLPLVFSMYVGASVYFDVNVAKPEKMFVQHNREQYSKKGKPLTYILFPPIFIGLAIFGVAATIRGFSAFEEKKKGEEEANRRRLEAEIALLKSQINPHFLVNTLNNLYALALTEPEKTPGALLKLSEMVAYILYECAKPTVPLSGDLEFIQNYIDLQRLRLPPNVTLDAELPADIPGNCSIEPMILIPFIENAFKHGLTTREACKIRIMVQHSGDQLRLQVENPLLPGKRSNSENGTGIGLHNTRQRLEHAYPGRYRLEVSGTEGKHQVLLELQLGCT